MVHPSVAQYLCTAKGVMWDQPMNRWENKMLVVTAQSPFAACYAAHTAMMHSEELPKYYGIVRDWTAEPLQLEPVCNTPVISEQV